MSHHNLQLKFSRLHGKLTTLTTFFLHNTHYHTYVQQCDYSAQTTEMQQEN